MIASLSFAQCIPDYDFGEEEFGVYPDPTEGETFSDGFVDMPYADTLHMIVPSDAGAIDEQFTGFPIDSIVLSSVTLTLGDVTYTPEELGLEYSCNNNGLAEDPCTVLGGQQGCASIFGTPNTPGLFSVDVTATVYFTFLGPGSFPYTFSDYTLLVEGEVSVAEISSVNFDLSQNKPNPFNKESYIDFNLAKRGDVKLTVLTLLGDVVHQEIIHASSGKNTVKLNAASYKPGVYLYRLEHGSFMATYRMVVSK